MYSCDECESTQVRCDNVARTELLDAYVIKAKISGHYLANSHGKQGALTKCCISLQCAYLREYAGGCSHDTMHTPQCMYRNAVKRIVNYLPLARGLSVVAGTLFNYLIASGSVYEKTLLLHCTINHLLPLQITYLEPAAVDR